MAVATAPVPVGKAEKRGLTLLAICVGAFMATSYLSIVNIALPQIARELGASLSTISWVMIAYLIANASLLPDTSCFADMLGAGLPVSWRHVDLQSGFHRLRLQHANLAMVPLGRTIQGAGASLMLGVAPGLTVIYAEGELAGFRFIFHRLCHRHEYRSYLCGPSSPRLRSSPWVFFC